MRRFVFGAFLVGFLTFYATAATYYIPHIHTADNSWETYLLLSNSSGDLEAHCKVDLYDEDGDLLTTFYVTVEPGETRTYSLRSYGGVAGTVACNAEYLTPRAGYIASASSGGGTAEFALPDQLTMTAKLDLSNYYDQLTWSGFAVFNGTDSDVTVTPRYFTTDGLEHTGSPFTLGAMEKRVDYFEHELGQPFTNLNTVVFETNSPALTAITISGKDNDKLLFTRSGEHADTWEVIDRYSSDERSWYSYAGQAVTDDYVMYAVSADPAHYGFNTLVKCFDKHTGELLWESDFYPDLVAEGIVAAANQDTCYVFGYVNVSSGAQYAVVCFDPDTGEEINTATYSYGTEFGYGNTYLRNILVAATGNTVLVVYQTPDGNTVRRLYGQDMSTTIDSISWDMDTVLTDLIHHNNYYYMLHSSFNETDEVYNRVNIYYFPYNTLMGGGKVHTFDNPRWDGLPVHVFADGAYIEGDYVYMMLKACAGPPRHGGITYLPISPADLRPATLNMSTNSWVTDEIFYSGYSSMNSNITIFRGPDDGMYAWVSFWYRSQLLQYAYRQGETYAPEFIGPIVEGDDLYIVTADDAKSGLDLESPQTIIIKVKKTSFTHFYRWGNK